VERQPEPEFMDLDEEAVAYAEADFSEVNQVFVERLMELTGALKRAVALDLGTGPGEIPLRVVARRPAWRIVAVDASNAMLRLARRLVTPDTYRHVLFVQADAKRLPVPSGCCDLVFSNSILHHITDTTQFWSEVKRVVRPGTFVLIRDLFRPDSELDARRLVERYAADESPLLQEEFYRSFLSAYTSDEVRRQLERVGLAGLCVDRVTDRHLDVYGWVA